MAKKEIIKKVEAKKEQLKMRLEEINSSNTDEDESKRIREKLSTFLKELDEISWGCYVEKTLLLVTKPTLERLVNKADFSTPEVDGEYCKLVLVQNFPYTDIWLIWISDIDF